MGLVSGKKTLEERYNMAGAYRAPLAGDDADAGTSAVFVDATLLMHRMYDSTDTAAQLTHRIVQYTDDMRRTLPRLFGRPVLVVVVADKAQFRCPLKEATSAQRRDKLLQRAPVPFEWPADRSLAPHDPLPRHICAPSNYAFARELWRACAKTLAAINAADASDVELIGAVRAPMIWDLPHACVVVPAHGAVVEQPVANTCREADVALIWWMRRMSLVARATARAADASVSSLTASDALLLAAHEQCARHLIVSYDSDMLAISTLQLMWLHRMVAMGHTFGAFLRTSATTRHDRPIVVSAHKRDAPFVFDPAAVLVAHQARMSGAQVTPAHVYAFVACMCVSGNDFVGSFGRGVSSDRLLAHVAQHPYALNDVVRLASGAYTTRPAVDVRKLSRLSTSAAGRTTIAARATAVCMSAASATSDAWCCAMADVLVYWRSLA